MAKPADVHTTGGDRPGDDDVARSAGDSAVRSAPAGDPDVPRPLEGMSPEQAVEWACSDQILRWRRGERVPCEAYFPLHAALGCDGAGVFDLIYSEFALRTDMGESPRLEEFAWRFPGHAQALRDQVALDRALEGTVPTDNTTIDADGPGDGGRPRAAAARPPGPSVAGYEIEAELGRGGMGVVYRARQLRLDRTVALKMILAVEHAATMAAARFFAEAQTIARLKHPNIVQIYAVGEQDGRPFFEMEYISGGSLAARLDGTPWSGRDAARLLEPLARGIHQAHLLGIVHRDLKPANILIGDDAVPKVVDFGLAKLMNVDTALTQSQSVLGSPSYMAPEQAEGKHRETGPAADIYALGAILYELITGRSPFRAATVLETLEQVKMNEPVPPSRLQPGLPRDVETICLKCLEKDPRGRYESAGALADDLRRYLDGEPIRARAVKPWERAAKWARRRPLIASLFVAVHVLGAALLGLGVWSYAQVRTSLSARIAADRQTRRALGEAIEARGRARAEAYRATLSQTEALRLAHPPGWRGEALGNLHRIAAMDGAGDDLARLRSEAAACLGDFDLREAERLEGHRYRVLSLGFSPDGGTLASADYDGSLRLWDLRGGRHLREFTDPDVDPLQRYGSGDSALPVVAFRPDGTGLMASTWRRGVALLDPAGSDDPVRTLEAPRRATDLAFDGAGRWMAVGWRDGEVGVYAAATGALRRTVAAGSRFKVPVALSPDGQWLAVAGASHDVQLHRLVGDTPPRVLGRHDNAVQSLRFSPDGTTLASASDDATVTIWNVASGKVLSTLRGHTGGVNRAAFSADGRWVATVSVDQSMGLWEPRTGRLHLMLQPRLGQLWDAQFSPDGNRLAIASERGTISVFRLTGTSERRALVGHDWGINAVAFRAGRPELATASPDNRLIAWDAGSGRPRASRKAHPVLHANFLAYGPDGATLAAGPGRFFETAMSQPELFAVRLLDADTGALRRLLPGPRSSIFGLCFDRAGTRLAAGSGDGRAFVWDVRTGATVWRSDPPEAGTMRPIALLDGGRRLLIAGVGGRLVLRELPGGEVVREAKVPGGIGYFAAGDDEGRLVVGGVDGALRLVRLPSLEVERTRAGDHQAAIRAMAMTPDGRLVASGAEDGRLWLHDGGTLRPILSLPPHSGPVHRMAFGGRGRYLAIAGQEKDATLWDVAALGSGLASIGLGWRPGELGRPVAGPGAADSVDVDAAPLRTIKAPPAAGSHRWPQLLRQAKIEAREGRWEEADALFEAAVADQPDRERSSAVARAFAEFLWARAINWADLVPLEMASEGGAQLAAKPDGSILAGGFNPDRDVYTVRLRSELTGVTGIRLTALPDPALPRRASGRFPDNGNFHLCEFELAVDPGRPGAAPVPVPLARATADAAKPGYPIDLAIDGDRETFWSAFPSVNVPRSAVFEPAAPIGQGEGPLTLVVTLKCSASRFPRHNLGRFRLWSTTAPNLAAHTVVSRGVRRVPNGWTQLAAAYYVSGDPVRALGALRRSADPRAGGGGIYDWLLVALAEQQLGRPDEAAARLDQAVGWMATHQVDEGAEFLAREALARVRGLDARAAADRAGELARRGDIARLSRSLEERPRDPALLRARAFEHARAGHWREAADDYDALARLLPGDHDVLYRGAILRLRLGEIAAYRAHCRALLERFADTTDPWIPPRTVLACLLAPPEPAVLERAARLADDAVELADERAPLAIPPAFLAQGLAAERAGAADRALDRLGACLAHPHRTWPWEIPAHLGRSLAWSRLGRADEARADLARAAEIGRVHLAAPEHDHGTQWHNQLIAEILGREAESRYFDAIFPDDPFAR